MTKLDPKVAINIPPIKVPIVVPEFTADKNMPFDKSGESGAAEVITYCVTFAEIPAKVPHAIVISIIGIENAPKQNIAIYYNQRQR